LIYWQPLGGVPQERSARSSGAPRST